jgi:hypothetical protein
MWGAKAEGLRATLAAQEQHAQALEQELAMRPTVLQVGSRLARYPAGDCSRWRWARMDGVSLAFQHIEELGAGCRERSIASHRLPSLHIAAADELERKMHAAGSCLWLARRARRPRSLQVEELKQQIRILQAVGYNSVEADDSAAGQQQQQQQQQQRDGGGGNGGGSGRPGGGPGGSLEALLLSKNRHLEHELTMARLKVVGSQQERDAALAQVGGVAVWRRGRTGVQGCAAGWGHVARALSQGGGGEGRGGGWLARCASPEHQQAAMQPPPGGKGGTSLNSAVGGGHAAAAGRPGLLRVEECGPMRAVSCLPLQVSELEAELVQQQQLVVQLEEDLSAAGQANETGGKAEPSAATRQLSGLLDSASAGGCNGRGARGGGARRLPSA